MGGRKLLSIEEAVAAKSQHLKPCSDCPWTREALPGWLGGVSIEEWLAAAHGEGRIDCHTLLGAECAGAAVYRANVAKLCRGAALRLPADREAVFGSPAEFAAHHSRRPG